MGQYVKHIPCDDVVTKSEKKALNFLYEKVNKPDYGYHIFLTNCSVNDKGSRLSEIDMILIGPKGVSVIEIKDWENSEKIIKLPEASYAADTLGKKTRIIHSLIKEIFACKCDNIVSSKFLFTREISNNPIKKERNNIKSIEVLNLQDWRYLIGKDKRSILDEKSIDNICKKIEGLSFINLNSPLNKIDKFHNLKQIGMQTEFQRIFYGQRKPDNRNVIMHLYDLSSTIEANDIKLEKARKEYKFLNDLQAWRSFPRIVDSFHELPSYPGELVYFSYEDHFSSISEKETFVNKLRASKDIISFVKNMSGGIIYKHFGEKCKYPPQDEMILSVFDQNYHTHDDCRYFKGIFENIKLPDNIKIDDWGCGSCMG